MQEVQSLSTPAAILTSTNRYGFPTWSLLYAIVFSFSFLAAISATATLRRSTKAITSCVCYAMLWFFVCKSIYSGSRVVLMGISMHEYLAGHSTWLKLDDDHDIGGFRLLGYENKTELGPPPLHVKLSLFVGDAALISGSLWMMVLVLELLRLVKTTMDRGADVEKKYLYFYLCVNLVVVGAYFTTQYAISIEDIDPTALSDTFYSDRFRAVLISAASIQTLVVVAVAFAVFYLNRTGLNLESVECRVVQSPLYRRLKRILVVYLLCSMPYLSLSWVVVGHGYNYMNIIPDPITILSSVLYAASGFWLAFVLVASQQCMLSWLMVSDDVIQQIQANEAPTDFPVFVNTDIESSSALWGHLGNVMHDAQDLHDNLLRELLVRHHGYEITTAGDSFQLAFHTIGDAVAYCLDVQEQLLLQPWPPAFVDSHMPGSATILVPQSMLKRPKTVFHGVRVRMGIHASTPGEGDLVTEIHPVTHRVTYLGLSELIGREVSDIGHGGQIIMTAPVVRWLRTNILNNSSWAQAHPTVVQELGVYRVSDLKIDLGIAQVVPLSLRERIELFPPLLKLEAPLDYARRMSNNYDLLISPKEYAV
ncbi:Aste57867_19006 [Aphanomyces stellatus]|uniref:Aste57867_19006 protein n=1 Tax=Aphanomyces stellatus TaxID=120398 RepID=A0A485LDH7_9STRA|nr:hypothetical protein As57867_018942 [Aphanomyces stellatus]VFT95731.1 Aste57867_19006 [Aphanomyces stellatus]